MRTHAPLRVNLGNRPVPRTRRAARLLFDRLEDRLAPAVTVPALSINDVTVTEGDAGTVNATFTVSLSTAGRKSITVAYATADGTAVAGTDYAATQGTLTFARGETSKTITVPVLGDTLDEANETFSVNLSAPIDATIAKGQGGGTIADNDPAPTIAIGDASLSEGNSGKTLEVFTVTLSAPSGQVVTVVYSMANGTATSGSDYTATSGRVTFAPGQTSRTVSVPVVGDTLDEADETFFVNLSSPSNALVLDAQGVGTIVDDDPSPSLSINDASISEGDAGTRSLSFTVSLSASSGRAVTVAYVTADGSAAAGSDYTAASGTVTFAPGTTTQTVSVPILGDTTFEPDETFAVNLSGAVAAAIARGQGTGTILNDDSAVLPSIAINDVTVTEGDTGSVNATFTVTLSAASSQVVTVAYATADGTAAAGSDYTPTSGTLTFNPGVTSQTISVPVLGDTTYEPDETFVLNLGFASNATIADNQGQGLITDNDPVPTVSIDDAGIVEGNSGTQNLVVRVRLSNPSSAIEWAVISTADGTATAGSDYTARTGVGVTFLAGVTEQTISIPIVGDTVVEPDETFLVNVTRASRVITDGQAVGTILNDDLAAAAASATTQGSTLVAQAPTALPGLLLDFGPAPDQDGTGPRPPWSKRGSGN